MCTIIDSFSEGTTSDGAGRLTPRRPSPSRIVHHHQPVSRPERSTITASPSLPVIQSSDTSSSTHVRLLRNTYFDKQVINLFIKSILEEQLDLLSVPKQLSIHPWLIKEVAVEIDRRKLPGNRQRLPRHRAITLLQLHENIRPIIEN